MTRVILATALVLAAPAGVARAYSAHTSFAEPAAGDAPADAGLPPDGGIPDGGAPPPPAAAPGGGGGRYFTGSIRDGYTCAVCHVGGGRAEATFEGLPAEGYVPGDTYPLTLELPEGASVAGAIEITDAEGNGVGLLALPPEEDLQSTDQCDDGATAAFATDLPQSRTVANVDACGARRLRVLWTAPAENVGSIWVHAVAVAGNADGRAAPPADDPDSADAVYELARLLPHYGEQATSSRATACAVNAPGASGRGAGLLLLGLVATVLRRRRR